VGSNCSSKVKVCTSSTEQFGVAMTYYSCIRTMPGSDFDQDVGNLAYGVMCLFPCLSGQMTGY
jgi:hypothetical protein